MKFYKFMSPSCSSCITMTKYLERLHNPNIEIEEINVLTHPELVLEYQVSILSILVSEDNAIRIEGFSVRKLNLLYENTPAVSTG